MAAIKTEYKDKLDLDPDVQITVSQSLKTIFSKIMKRIQSHALTKNIISSNIFCETKVFCDMNKILKIFLNSDYFIFISFF